MQKKLLAAAVLSAFSGAAAAQSANVTIYGTLFSDFENAQATGGDGTNAIQANSGGGAGVSPFRTLPTTNAGAAVTTNPGTVGNLGNGNYGPTPAAAGFGVAGVADPASRYRLMGSGANFGLRGTEEISSGLAAWFQLEVGTAAALGGVQATSSTSLGGYQGLTYRNSAIGLKGNGWGSVLMGIWDTPLTVAFGQAALVPKLLSANSANISAGFFGTNPFVGGGTFSGTSIVQACTNAGTAGTTIGGSAAACLTATMNQDRRQAGTLQYWTPNWGGFEGRIMFTPTNENFAAGVNNTALGSANTAQLGTASLNTLKPWMWGLSANYSIGGFFGSYSYQRMTDVTAAGVRQFGGIALSNNTATNNGATGNFGVSMPADINSSKDELHRIGLKYKFAFGLGIGGRYEWMNGSYGYANAPGATANTTALTNFTGFKKKTWGLAVSYENGAHAVVLEYARSPDITVSGQGGPTAAPNAVNGTATNARVWTIGYDYALSKRTDIRTYYTNVNNDTNARYQGTVFNGLQPVAGGDPRYIGVGLRHAF